jgi:hypothetical protein
MNTPEIEEITHAILRLGELTETMNQLWRRSVAETAPDSEVDLYVVDADVVMMYMAPYRNHNYGTWLRDDSEARKTDGPDPLSNSEAEMVEFLGNFLFFRLNQSLPVALLPDHAVELENKLGALGATAIEEVHNWDALATELHRISENIYQASSTGLEAAEAALLAHSGQQDGSGSTVLKTVEAEVSELFQKIFDSLRGQGAVFQLFRFEMLINNNRLLHLDRFPLFDEHGQTVYFPSPIGPDGKCVELVTRAEAEFSAAMSRYASKQHPKRSRTRNVASDAKALAHLAWLNAQLRDEKYYLDVNGSRRRVGKLLLISGSQTIVRAVKDAKSSELHRVIFSPLSFLGHRLMDQYVEGVSSSAGTSSQETLESSLVANFLSSMQQSLSAAAESGVLNVIAHALDLAKRDQIKMVESWNATQLLSRSGVNDTVSRAILWLEDSGQSLHRLHGFLQDLSVATFHKFARSVAYLNYTNYANVRTRSVLRNIPPVVFSGEEANTQARALRLFGFQPQGAHTDGPLNIHKLRAEDATHYSEFMCFGLWSLGHLQSHGAKGCVEVALSIVEKAGDRRADHMEALFIRAHLLKLFAKSAHDLNRAVQCLEEAFDLNTGEGKKPPDLRYEAEKFSLCCHQLYLGAFRDRGKTPATEALLKTIEWGIDLLWKLPPAGDSVSRSYASEYMRQQLLGNLLHLGLMSQFGHLLGEKGEFQIFVPVEPDSLRIRIQELVTPLIPAFVELCEFLNSSPPDQDLPKSSTLSLSVAAVATDVWLAQSDIAGWFETDDSQLFLIDSLRFRHLTAIRLRQGR